MPLPLKDIISALVNDVSIASIRADINRSHWQDVYDDNDIFREFSPSKVRISELNVSIPLAIEDVQREKMIDPAITSRQLLQILPPSLPARERKAYADAVRDELLEKKIHLLSKNAGKKIVQIATTLEPDIQEQDFNLAYLSKLKREYISRPNQESETRFVYKASELEKIKSEHIIRIEMSLLVD